MKRAKPGLGWRHIAGGIWEHKPSGLRIHSLGLVFVGGVYVWCGYWPYSSSWDRHTRIAGGRRIRGLMTLALEIAKGDES